MNIVDVADIVIAGNADHLREALGERTPHGRDIAEAAAPNCAEVCHVREFTLREPAFTADVRRAQSRVVRVGRTLVRRANVQRLALSLTCLLALAASAHAEPDSPPHVSLTVEPLYLIVTMVDATAEVRVAPRVGAAVIAGYGRPLLGAALWNLGGEVNAYLMRDFSGLHVGAELQYMGGSFGIPFVTETMPTDPLRIYGGYVGYKCVTRRGFTSVLQAGVGHISGGGTSTDAPVSKLIPIANFTAGWSF